MHIFKDDTSMKFFIPCKFKLFRGIWITEFKKFSGCQLPNVTVQALYCFECTIPKEWLDIKLVPK